MFDTPGNPDYIPCLEVKHLFAEFVVGLSLQHLVQLFPVWMHVQGISLPWINGHHAERLLGAGHLGLTNQPHQEPPANSTGSVPATLRTKPCLLVETPSLMYVATSPCQPKARNRQPASPAD